MSRLPSRRVFLKHSAAASATLWSAPGLFARRHGSSLEKLSVAVIGCGGRGWDNLNGVAGEHVFALCDVDSGNLARAAERFPGAKEYRDFRKMIERGGFDAVVVSTPDHTHYLPSALALQARMHVYCEKPLAWSVAESRQLRALAGEWKSATQMGTQIHAGANYRRVVELVRSGALGAIGEVHVWCGKTWSGGERSKETPKVPATLDWELWLGPAPERPYHPDYHPAGWRRWWDFGGGTLGDMGCHFVDLVFWALELDHPTKIRADGPERHTETTPPNLHVAWDFPAREKRGAVQLHWYDTDRRPALVQEQRVPDWGNGVLFVGEKGMLLADYGRYLLLPEAEWKEFQPPAPTIEPSIGHHAEWIRACKGEGETTCSFAYAGLLSEAILLGNVAYRVGKPMSWDGAAGRSPDVPEAQALLDREPRAGWRA